MSEPIKITIEMNGNTGKIEIADQIKSALARQEIGLKCVGEDYSIDNRNNATLKFRY